MAKILDITGLAFLAIMTLGFVGVLEPYGIKNGTSDQIMNSVSKPKIIQLPNIGLQLQFQKSMPYA